jgi:glycosyltransferase involved in cell wall biosynthesis
MQAEIRSPHEEADSPALTLVVPTLDSHQLLPRLVGSLQEQTWPHWRVLFIDGPSGPAHRAWLEALCASDQRFSWQSQDPGEKSIFGAMNQGMAAADAPTTWLLLWGSDDWAAGPAVFAKLIASLTAACARGEAPDLLVCTGRYASGEPGGTLQLGRRTAFRWRRSFRRSLFLGSTPPHQATLIGPGARRLVARHAPGFLLSADLDYFLQLSRFPALRVAQLDLELVHMAEGGVSGQRTGRRLQEVRQAYRRAFGGLWWIPFLLRYVQRIESLLRL